MSITSIPYDQMGVPQKSSDSSQAQSYTPTPEEEELIRKLDGMFQKAKKKRENYDQKWADYYRFFRGQQWKDKKPSYRHSEVINFVFQVIQSQVPLLADARPRFEYLPQDPTDLEFSEILNDVCDYDWVKNNWLFILIEVLYECKVFGTGLSTLYFDPEKNDSLGGQCYESIDVFIFFPNPEAKDIDRDCYFIITAEPKSMDWYKIHYKEKAKYIKPDVVDFEFLDRAEIGNGKSQATARNSGFYEQEKGGNYNATDDKAILYTHHFLDRETYNEILKNLENGQSVTEQGALKYPNGRKVVRAGNVILEDKENVYSSFPYQKMQNYVLSREFWGMSEIEQIEGPQLIFNKIYSFVLDVLTLMGNPVWIIDSESKVNQDGLVNKPGLVVTKKQGSEVRREAGVQLQPYVLNILQSVQGFIGDVSGSQEISQGVAPAGMAADAIRRLQESAQTRIRLNSKILDCYLQNMGSQWLENTLEFYTIPLIYRITNKDGLDKYFKFHIRKDEENGKKFAAIRRYNKNEETGEYLPGTYNEHEIKGKFDVRVMTGNSLPFARSEKEEKTLKLYDKGLIDQEETLKQMEYPNYQKIIQRMQEAKMAEAQMAQQQMPA